MSTRNTIQKRLVLVAMAELDSHATAEQVYEHVAAKYPSISRATVYRNMAQMVKSGELLNIGNFHGAARYDHNCHDHYHFVCDECRRVFDVDGYFEDISDRVIGMEDFEIKNHSLSFSGLCSDCKE